ncbi:MAG: TusE/DsrC/DsvC family sulfur relay protein [Candidatus Thiosymbion ectosymbiont of Robbea hypermnestra]|nr:TusE/DsrC/DsvC family sulfur relay protein [Candidatus Thiosymbion ectosymbiont of Robbea hypermnestra]
MTIDVPLDGEGFLVNREDWSEAIAKELATADAFEMTEQVMGLIREARVMYDENGVVPPIRKFAKEVNVSSKDLYAIFKKGPMKLICKWGGLPKPTGCV